MANTVVVASITSIDTDNGLSNADFDTNDQTLGVSGTYFTSSSGGGPDQLTFGVWAVKGASSVFLGQVTVAPSGPTVDPEASWSIAANGSILGEGAWTLETYLSSSTSNSLPDSGSLLGTQALTIDITAPTVTVPGTQTVLYSDGGTVTFGSSYSNQITVGDNNTDVLRAAFLVEHGTLHVTGTAPGITIYFNNGDRVLLDGTAAAINSFINNNLTYSADRIGDEQIGAITFDHAGNGTLDFVVVHNIADVTCFMAGAMIRTPDGEVAVERLKTGDLVLTADGRAMPVRWLGRQTVSTIFGDKLRILPIRIKAGAFRENVPSRDLLVSPDHAILIDDVLAQAAALVNETSIVRETAVPRIFTDYHVELDDHSLIVAENTPVETFVDNVDRLGFDNWAEHEALYPEGKTIEELSYPRAKSRRQIPPYIRVVLAERAMKLGYASDQAAVA